MSNHAPNQAQLNLMLESSALRLDFKYYTAFYLPCAATFKLAYKGAAIESILVGKSLIFLLIIIICFSRLITGMGNYEICTPKPQPGSNSKPAYTLHGESEELNRMVSRYSA